MSRVSTNTVGLAYAIEDSLGVLPGSPVWKSLEPNDIGTFGAAVSKVSRNPISRDRQRKKGTTTDLDSSVEFDADLTMEHFIDFMEGFTFAVFNGPIKFGPQETDDVTAVTGTDSFTVTANGALTAGELVYARGFTNSANNGLHVVDTGSTATDLVVTSTLVAEASPPANATVEVCGVQGAAGDLEINASGNLASTALDFTTLDLTVGQAIWIGGTADATRFGTAASPSANRGWARITAIAANELTLDKKSDTFVTDTGTGKTIHLYFGKFLRNVAVDDVDYVERSFQFEGSYPDLGGVGTDEYEYAVGNFCNEISFNLALTDKATISLGFIGTNTDDITATRKTNAASAINPQQTVAFNTSADIARLRIIETDETGVTTFFKNLTLTLNNNVSPEKVLGTLGAAFVNVGNFDVNIESQVLFTNSEVINAIKNNTTLAIDFSLRNDDGALFFDLPAVTLNDGGKEFPENETVLVNTPAEAFEDPTLGTSIGISLFGFVPAS